MIEWKEILFLISGIMVAVGIGYLIVHNTITFKEDCINKNKTMYLSYNDTECGCKWYNLCDQGCLICKENQNESSNANDVIKTGTHSR